MTREAARRLVVYAAAVVFAAALVHRLYSLGGPYFEFPDTVQDHVAVVRWPSADAIVLSRNAAKILPRGATVTILQPSAAPNYDATHYLTGVGLMPHQRVVRPAAEALRPCEQLHERRIPRRPFLHGAPGQIVAGLVLASGGCVERALLTLAPVATLCARGRRCLLSSTVPLGRAPEASRGRGHE